MGKTLKEARGDVQEAIDTCHFFQSEGRRLYGQTVPSEMQRKELTTYRRPLGVVGIITAGNFPIAVPSWKIIPALVTGNTIVWKPSEDCPASSYAFAKLIEEAGLPNGVLNVVFGGGKGGAGQFLVDMIDERDERFLLNVAQQTALHVQNVTLLAQRERQIRELDAIGRIGQLASATFDLDEILDVVYTTLQVATGAPIFYLLICEADTHLVTNAVFIEQGQRNDLSWIGNSPRAGSMKARPTTITRR